MFDTTLPAVHISKKVRDKIILFSRKFDVSESDIIRFAINVWLEKQLKKMKGGKKNG